MRVTGRVAARAVFDEHALDALAGNVRQLVLVDEGHLGVIRLRRIREGAAKRQGGDKQRTEDAFHGALSSGWPPVIADKHQVGRGERTSPVFQRYRRVLDNTGGSHWQLEVSCSCSRA